MSNLALKTFNFYKTLIILFVIVNSCSYPQIDRDELVYENTFDNKKNGQIDGAIFSEYNNSTVIGNFNNNGFTLHLDNIGEHDYIFISFDLYIHGSWDGNANGFNLNDHGFNDKPDIWGLELNPELSINLDESQKFETTFSNSPCFPNYCLKQSFPNNFPMLNSPKAGATITNLPKNCFTDGWNSTGTSLYKIEKIFHHKSDALIVRFYDRLFQPNAIDAYGNNFAKCDESWSLDNLRIRVISYK
tara:strand:- start:100 stop:834 length:735 start_codon:yes stop_codon:yes gene_type:complete